MCRNMIKKYANMFRKRLAGKFYGLLRKTAIYIKVILIKNYKSIFLFLKDENMFLLKVSIFS